MKVKLPVIHYAQYLDAKDPEWQARACPIASLVMVLDYYGKEVNLDKAMEKAFKIKVRDKSGVVGPHDPKFGWRHDAIVELAKHYGFESYRTENDTIESLIESILNDEPVLLSIHKKL